MERAPSLAVLAWVVCRRHHAWDGACAEGAPIEARADLSAAVHRGGAVLQEQLKLVGHMCYVSYYEYEQYEFTHLFCGIAAA